MWTWHLKSSIGDVIATGTNFTSKDNCLSAINLVKLASGASCSNVTPAPTQELPSGIFRVQPA
jgi:uncharacterized protein YegP (UPF0339 family)